MLRNVVIVECPSCGDIQEELIHDRKFAWICHNCRTLLESYQGKTKVHLFEKLPNGYYRTFGGCGCCCSEKNPRYIRDKDFKFRVFEEH